MSNAAISVENLGKAYRIGLKEESPDTLMGVLTGWMKYPLRNWHRLRSLNTFDVENPAGESDSPSDIVWALRDVSFDLQPGEVVGVIGRNGAGKSTLLKILSRITEPTSGRATIRGRVSSLLEVGTGFHPELSGRENIYMNGTVLGMTKREIDRKFDEIVDFSGVERFLDTPVKRYSSGMKVRLAFAVAAHLEPEILVIDEVLAVGDAEFQKKCLGKMELVAESGRTVLFVSHNMTAVTNLCQRGLVLKDGGLAFDGPTDKAVEYYSSLFTANKSRGPDEDLNDYREPWCRPLIKSARIVEDSGLYPPEMPLGSSITIEMTFDPNDAPIRFPVMGLTFHHVGKGTVAAINTRIMGYSPVCDSTGLITYTCVIPKLPFIQGLYNVDVWLGDGPANIDVLMHYLSFEVSATDYYGSGKPPMSHMGTVLLDAKWRLEHKITEFTG